MTDTADVIVLGMGVGGELLAEHVADAGLDVVGIEANLVGDTHGGVVAHCG